MNFFIVYSQDDSGRVWTAKIYTHDKEEVGMAGPDTLDEVVRHVDRLTSRYQVLQEMPSLLKGIVPDEEKD
jgi:hypothetical protein